MMIRRLDDYQSWALEQGGKRLLIDPWLSDEHHLPGGHWVFGRRREVLPQPLSTWLPVDALILTAHFSDHLHFPTIEQLPRETPVFASTTAARMIRKRGFTNVTALKKGDAFIPWEGLNVQVLAPGFPYAHNSLGFIFEADAQRVYFETHMAPPRIEERGPFDAIVAPMQAVRVMGIPFVQSPEKSVALAKKLNVKWWVPTGNDPQQGHGLFTAVLFMRGERKDFAPALQHAGSVTRFVEPSPGEAIDVATGSIVR